MKKITPYLWFDHQAEEAAAFYTAIFSNSKRLVAGCSERLARDAR
jgi:predicted 3-demethylubiquinone-9 3-methyltransferase (glyoxalase superfamily)